MGEVELGRAHRGEHVVCHVFSICGGRQRRRDHRRQRERALGRSDVRTLDRPRGAKKLVGLIASDRSRMLDVACWWSRDKERHPATMDQKKRFAQAKTPHGLGSVCRLERWRFSLATFARPRPPECAVRRLSYEWRMDPAARRYPVGRKKKGNGPAPAGGGMV